MDTLKYIVKKYNIKINPLVSRTYVPVLGRNDFGVLFKELGFKRGVEIGTEEGYYAEILCKGNPDMELFCIDPWILYDDNKGYKPDTTQNKFNQMYEDTIKRIAHKYNTNILRKTSMEAVKDFQDNSLDFVYIDGNHCLEYVINDIAYWTDKVRPGGIVAGHDYIRYRKQCYSHVVEALTAYNESYRRELPYFILLNKRGGNVRSWFFIK